MTIPATDASVALDRLFEAACRVDEPGYVAGIAQDGKLLYRRAFGMASLEHGVANTPATRMRIGSTTKHLTSLAVLLLAEDGMVELDAPLRCYLPELTGALGDPTLRQLMNHTSGIRDSLDTTAFFLTEGLYPKVPVETTYRWSQRYARMNHPPGERWIYSNMGYNLLSFAIERTTGKSLATVFQERLFAPLGMVDTALSPDDMHIVPGIASFHTPAAHGGFNRGIYPCDLLGAGGIVSTVDDMLRWMAHLRNPVVVGSADTWATFRARPRFASGIESDYCMGLMRQLHRGPELVHHAGGTLGCNCMMLTVPEHALDIIIMSNRMDSDPTGMAIRIVEALLGGALRPRAPAASLKGLEGVPGLYLGTHSRLLVEVGGKGDALSVSIANGPLAPVTHRDGSLVAESLVGPVVVHLPDVVSGKPQELELSNCGIREVFSRLAEPAPAIEDLAASVAGPYRLADFDTPVEIVFEEGKLSIDVLSRYRPTRLTLEVLSADVLRASGAIHGIPFTGTVLLEWAEGGTVNGFTMTGPRTWHLQFLRTGMEAGSATTS